MGAYERMKASVIKKMASFFWHPHQGLWNWELMRVSKKILRVRFLYDLFDRIVVFVDTLLLYLRSRIRRVKRLGFFSLFSKNSKSISLPIIYFDLGTHREGKELEYMVDNILKNCTSNYQAFGFEASTEFYNVALNKFQNIKGVKMINGALCHSLPKNSKIRLYKGVGEGLESSIFRPNLDSFEEVNAIRLTEWIRDSNLSLTDSICLIRMNIEGSESDVIDDLVDADIVSCIDGFYGMWDDVSKISMDNDREFRRKLKKYGVSPFTFNGRDFRSKMRLNCIKYDVFTSILVGMNKYKNI